MTIAIDFDGTVVKHEYPNVGEDIPFAEETIKNLVEQGHKIILYTMRSGKYLEDAVNWFLEKGIPLYGINKNPSQIYWTTSRKVYAHLYIDDAALGCPKIYPTDINEKPYVNWEEVKKILL